MITRRATRFPSAFRYVDVQLRSNNSCLLDSLPARSASLGRPEHKADELDATPAVCLGCHPRRRALCPPRVAAVARPQRPRRESAPFARAPVPPPRRVAHGRRRTRQHCRFGPARAGSRIRHLCRAALEVEPAALAASCLVSALNDFPSLTSAVLTLGILCRTGIAFQALQQLCTFSASLKPSFAPTDSLTCRRPASDARSSYVLHECSWHQLCAFPPNPMEASFRMADNLACRLSASACRPFTRLTDLLLRTCYEAENKSFVLR